MKEILKKICILVLALNCMTTLLYAKGRLTVTTIIEPYGTTKKYSNTTTLLLDAGALNSNSNIGEIMLAKVTVIMQTERITSDGDTNPDGIIGDFNVAFKLNSLETFGNQPVKLGKLIKYKNGDVADMNLSIRNTKILSKKIIDEDIANEYYYFIAFPEESYLKNKVESLSYSFDLYLSVSGTKVGDIIRKDVETKAEGQAAIGRIQDIIKEQFRALY